MLRRCGSHVVNAADQERFSSSRLAHAASDAINAVLAAAGYNFRRLIRWLNLCCSGYCSPSVRRPATFRSKRSENGRSSHGIIAGRAHRESTSSDRIGLTILREAELSTARRMLDPGSSPSASRTAPNILCRLASAQKSPINTGLRAKTSALRQAGRDSKFPLSGRLSPNLPTARI